ncbi:CMRF35-like molecule 1 isoform X2 [Ctenopharyngodon idella]|uniref:CMRF35-like molecule 1 isoform X2 n=1 Tax=Ctenopharyngodon idella TaxID=7959 RepID=UPI00223176A4|nr:CMRF35-like molecule 1 isoform X2 [Ctenopharyngodon idella]
MWSFLVVLSCIFTVVSLNPVTAPVGGNATFRYHFLASVNIKYFCRDSCEDEFILIRSNKKQNPTRTDRFTLYDEGSDFTVTITRLQLSDSGTYICAVDRLIKDTYKHVTLHVYEVSISTPVPSSASSPSARTTRNTIENNGKSVTMQSSADTSPETMHGSALSAVVVGAPDTVTGHRGERVEIRCSYESGYESNSKYFCKGKCSFGFKNIMVESGSAAKDERFSLTDDTTNRVFTVTITDLRTEDEGQYWCAVKRGTLTTDVYSEILLLVKQDKKTTEVSTISPFLSTSTSAPLTPQVPLPQTSSLDTGSFGIIIAGVLVFLLIGAVLPIVVVRKKKLTCGLVSSSTEALRHTFRGEENDYEGNPTVLPNSHTAQSDNISAANEFHRPVNTEPANTDLDYTNVTSAATNSQNLDQIYTELNASRQSHIYQCLRADSAREESIYHNTD